jgi:hypothetical protein
MMIVPPKVIAAAVANTPPAAAAPPVTPLTNLDLLRILAADASITDPMSLVASPNGKNISGFRAAALTATGAT